MVEEEDEIKKLLLQRAMKKLKSSKILIEVITSPGCPYCPRAVMMANELSKKYGVKAREISTSTPEGIEKVRFHNIMGTPTILINDEVAFVGVPNFEEFEKEIRRRLNV